MGRTLMTALAAAALVVSGGGIASASDAPPRTTHGPCQYTRTPDEPAARPVPLPPDPRRTPSRAAPATNNCYWSNFPRRFVSLFASPCKGP